jgi:hypothetical protein
MSKKEVMHNCFTLGLHDREQRYLNEICDLTGQTPEAVLIRALKFYGTGIKAMMKMLSQNDLKAYFEEEKKDASKDIRRNEG